MLSSGKIRQQAAKNRALQKSRELCPLTPNAFRCSRTRNHHRFSLRRCSGPALLWQRRGAPHLQRRGLRVSAATTPSCCKVCLRHKRAVKVAEIFESNAVFPSAARRQQQGSRVAAGRCRLCAHATPGESARSYSSRADRGAHVASAHLRTVAHIFQELLQ